MILLCAWFKEDIGVQLSFVPFVSWLLLSEAAKVKVALCVDPGRHAPHSRGFHSEALNGGVRRTGGGYVGLAGNRGLQCSVRR